MPERTLVATLSSNHIAKTICIVCLIAFMQTGCSRLQTTSMRDFLDPPTRQSESWKTENQGELEKMFLQDPELFDSLSADSAVKQGNADYLDGDPQQILQTASQYQTAPIQSVRPLKLTATPIEMQPQSNDPNAQCDASEAGKCNLPCCNKAKPKLPFAQPIEPPTSTRKSPPVNSPPPASVIGQPLTPLAPVLFDAQTRVVNPDPQRSLRNDINPSVEAAVSSKPSANIESPAVFAAASNLKPTYENSPAKIVGAMVACDFDRNIRTRKSPTDLDAIRQPTVLRDASAENESRRRKTTTAIDTPVVQTSASGIFAVTATSFEASAIDPANEPEPPFADAPIESNPTSFVTAQPDNFSPLDAVTTTPEPVIPNSVPPRADNLTDAQFAELFGMDRYSAIAESIKPETKRHNCENGAGGKDLECQNGECQTTADNAQDNGFQPISTNAKSAFQPPADFDDTTDFESGFAAAQKAPRMIVPSEHALEADAPTVSDDLDATVRCEPTADCPSIKCDSQFKNACQSECVSECQSECVGECKCNSDCKSNIKNSNGEKIDCKTEDEAISTCPDLVLPELEFTKVSQVRYVSDLSEIDRSAWQPLIKQTIDSVQSRLTQESDPNVKTGYETNLRLLQLLERNMTSVEQKESTLAPAERQYWRHQMDAITTMLESNRHLRSNLPNQEPASPSTIATGLAHLRHAVEELEALAGLRLMNAEFCTEINGFGQTRRFPSLTFEPNQPVLIYCEVENHQSTVVQTHEGEKFITRLRGQFSISNAAGESIQSGEFPVVKDTAQSKRRDFYLYFPITFDALPAGSYNLQISVNDLTSKQESNLEESLEFNVEVRD